MQSDIMGRSSVLNDNIYLDFFYTTFQYVYLKKYSAAAESFCKGSQCHGLYTVKAVIILNKNC